MSNFTNNNGLKYERHLAELFGVSYAGTASNRPDLVIEGIGVEVKCTPTYAGYGQLSVRKTDGVWNFTTRAKSAVLRSAAIDCGIIEKIRQDWDAGGKDECNTFVKSAVIRHYYKEKSCDYIQIKDRGLFRLGIRDPWNIGVPMFNPSGTYFRARRKKYLGGGYYSSTLELRIKKCPFSPVDLESLA